MFEKPNQSRISLLIGIVVCGSILLFSLLGAHQLVALEVLPLNSPVIQPAQPTPNLNFVYASEGRIIFCNDSQRVSFSLPAGFTTEPGAEVHCDSNPMLPQVAKLNNQLFQYAWDKQGYLIGIYPRVPLAKPLVFIFKIDGKQAKRVCRGCFMVRYYDPAKQKWLNLPTVYDVQRLMVTAKIDKVLPASGYPAYADRPMIALFTLK